MKLLKLAILSVLIVWPVFACKMSSETDEKQIPSVDIRTGPESIAKGKKLFDLKCAFCHDLDGSGDRVGPGMGGILKHSKLPVSNRPATPENIKKQLLEPYERMPSFTYLQEEDIQDLIAFLNTL